MDKERVNLPLTDIPDLDGSSLTLTPDNNDLFHQFVLKGVDSRGANQVEIRFAGKGTLAYQVARSRGQNPNQPSWRERYYNQGMTHILTVALDLNATLKELPGLDLQKELAQEFPERPNATARMQYVFSSRSAAAPAWDRSAWPNISLSFFPEKQPSKTQHPKSKAKVLAR